VVGRHATKFLERIQSVLSHYHLHSLSAEIQQTLMCCGDTPGGNPMPHAASHQDEPSVFVFFFVDLAGTGASLDICAFITAATISLCTTITATITTATTTTTKLTTSQ
jgi:hypothetical protein